MRNIIQKHAASSYSPRTRTANWAAGLLLISGIILIEFITRHPPSSEHHTNSEPRSTKALDYTPAPIKVISSGVSHQTSPDKDIPFVCRPKDGQSINDIAAVFGISAQEIAAKNGFTFDYDLPLPTNRLIEIPALDGLF